MFSLFVGHKLLKLNSVRSTNDYLKEQMKKERLPEGSVVVTQHQTSGRGQRGRKWENEKGKNLTISILFYPVFLHTDQRFLMNEVISLGLVECLTALETGEKFSVKWPNDIYWKNRKMAGILIENSITSEYFSSSVVGIGINVNQTVFSSEANRAVSLKGITRQDWDKEQLLEELCSRVENWYLKLKKFQWKEISKAYHEVLYLSGQWHEFSNERNKKFQGKILGVSDSGELRVKVRGKGIVQFAHREINFHP